MGAARAGRPAARRLQPAAGVRGARGRRLRERRDGARGAGARIGARAVVASRRAEARRIGSSIVPARNVGCIAAAPAAHKLYFGRPRREASESYAQEIETPQIDARKELVTSAREGGAHAIKIMSLPIPVEYASQRKIRERNKLYYRRSEEHTSELQSRENLVCRLLLEKKKQQHKKKYD